MSYAPPALEFEVADHLHANFGAVDPDQPPGEWVELLRVWAGSGLRAVVSWRKGSRPYAPIPGGALELAMEVEKKDDHTGEVKKINPRADPMQWATDIAKNRWAHAVDWARRNGPNIDAQLTIWAWNDKKGCLEPIKGAASAKKIDLSGSGGTMEMPSLGTPEYMCYVLLTALDAKDKRMNEQLEKATAHLEKVGTVLDNVIGLADKRLGANQQNQLAAAMDRQADRDFFLKMMQMRMTAEGIDKAVKDLKPLAEEFMRLWGPDAHATRAKPEAQKIAESIRSTITDDQRAKFKEAGEGDLLEDFEKCMAKIAKSEDKGEITSVLQTLLGRIKPHRVLFQQLLSDDQQVGFVQLLEAAGLRPSANG